MRNPEISIVVPSYNQGQFLRECLQSIFTQSGVDFEVLICDGGSRDCTRDVIKEFSPRLAYWYSERDGGQSDALNAGFAKARGKILMWVNSDDMLERGVLERIASSYRSGLVVYAGPVHEIYEGEIVRTVAQYSVFKRCIESPWLPGYQWHMPGIAFNREVWTRWGPLDKTYRYMFDAKFISSALTCCHIVDLGDSVARFRLHENSKTVAEKNGFYCEGWRLLLEQRKRMAMVAFVRALAYYLPRAIIGWVQKPR